jgi:hypothetical protein
LPAPAIQYQTIGPSDVIGEYTQASAGSSTPLCRSPRAAFPSDWSVSSIQARADALDKIGESRS